MDTFQVLSLLFGTGGAASLVAFFKLWFERKDAFDTARREHIEDLARWRGALQDSVHELQALVEYYRHMSADYAWQLRQNGIEPHTTAVEPAPRTTE
ncbi:MULTISPECIES: hypothetical protein [Streptomyces]|uniref:hypothetical protein n=1 Tax=Streptomyces TaxID=1883 RepID=UPI001E2DBA67|nr:MULTISPECIES: hypothetical protein [Streptomyces]UFQ16424.1 hypothetical protein J2N69_16225 [Streptomyces huasconensis]WCL86027.1 hypothetical protein PPN52_16230 [Streptomyces sp. JCM 35825]